MLVKDVMHKGLHLIDSALSIKKASMIMAKLDIGCLVIGRPDNLEGIFSERDLMNRVVGPGVSADDTPVSEVMTKNVLTVEESEGIEDVLTKMEKKKIRHLPVVSNNGICIGMIGIRDLMDAMLKKLDTENKIMVDYLLAVSRVAIAIMDMGDQFAVEEDKKMVINHQLSKSEFEDLTDTSNQTLNKVLASFQDEGLITVEKNKIVILDKDKLLNKVI